MGIEFINELHWNQGCGHKKVHVAPHIGFPYSPLNCDMWYFLCVCKSSHCMNERELWIAFIEWKIYENDHTNELHWNQGFGHKKVHVAPHIGFPYSPLNCDMWYFLCVCKSSHCVNERELWIAFIEWKIYENDHTNELHWNQGCAHKKVQVAPHIGFPYSPLNCDMWYFLCICKSSHCVNERELWIAFIEWKIYENDHTNELHWNQGCGHKKVHVAPHIGFPYSSLSCDMWYFLCVCKTSHCVNGRQLWITFIDWKIYGNWVYKWSSLQSGMNR